MKVKPFLTTPAVIGFLFAVGLILMPAQIPAMHGITADEGMQHMAQNFGSALLAIAVVSWLARNTPDSIARRAIVWGVFTYWVFGSISTILVQLKGLPNNLNLITIAFHVPLAVIFGILALKQRGTIETQLVHKGIPLIKTTFQLNFQIQSIT